METIHELLKKADALFDEGKYDEAIALFRQVALSETPSSTHLTNMRLAQDLQQFQFAIELAEKYPLSVSVVGFRIRAELEYGQAKKAVTLCTEALNQAELLPDAQIQFISLRFRAAIQSAVTSYAKDDFLAIWESLKGSKGRRVLLNDLLSVTSIEFTTVFTALADEQQLSTNIRALFQDKTVQLRQINQLRDIDLLS